MSPLFETVKVINGNLLNIDFHNNRVNQSRQCLNGNTDLWDLRELIIIPELPYNQTYKCKLIYGEKLGPIEFQPYKIKLVNTLKLIECPGLTYNFKYLDRKALEILKKQNPLTDDIIIVQNERITDCTYANLVFYDGKKWITPATPLLNGTKRQKYIEGHVIFVGDIKINDLKFFTKARLINAMIDIEECPDIPIGNIFY